jgi:putative PIN family toxin of toxin-antitoxin system
MQHDNNLRVVVDTNVLVNGLFGFKDSPSSQMLHAIRIQKVILITSPVILEEIGEVISRERIVRLTKMNIEERKEFMDMLLERCEITEGKQLLQEGSRDIKDNKFLECGTEGQADYIITGDDDLLVLKEFENVIIITPREFLKKLKGI